MRLPKACTCSEGAPSNSAALPPGPGAMRYFSKGCAAAIWSATAASWLSATKRRSISSKLMDSTNLAISPDKSVHPVSAILQRNLNLLILGQVPLLAFMSTLFFPRDQLRFSEHLVLTAYTSSLRSVFFMLLVLPAWWLFNLNYNLIVAAYMTLWVLYFGFASAQFYRGKRLWLGFKGVLVAALAQAITMLVITAAYSAYFYYFHKR